MSRASGLAAPVLLLLGACSSGGGTRPPPVPQVAPITVMWTEVTTDLDGQPVQDITGYTVTYGLAGSIPTTLSVAAHIRALELRLPYGRWDFAVVANSESLGAGAPGRAFREVP